MNRILLLCFIDLTSIFQPMARSITRMNFSCSRFDEKSSYNPQTNTKLWALSASKSSDGVKNTIFLGYGRKFHLLPPHRAFDNCGSRLIFNLIISNHFDPVFANARNLLYLPHSSCSSIDHRNAYVMSGDFRTKTIPVLLFLIKVNTLPCEDRDIKNYVW